MYTDGPEFQVKPIHVTQLNEDQADVQAFRIILIAPLLDNICCLLLSDCRNLFSLNIILTVRQRDVKD